MLIAFHNHHVQLIFTLCNVENLYLSDMLWRYPNPFLAQPPPSPLETQVKSGLPGEFSFKSLKDINSNNATVEEFFHSDHETLGIENQTTRVK